MVEEAQATRQLNMAGAGRHYFWSVVPQVTITFGFLFIVSLCVREVGPAMYGVVVIVNGLTAILNIFTGSLRFAVTHADASSQRPDQEPHQRQAAIRDIQYAHSLFVYISLVMGAIGSVVGLIVCMVLGLTGQDGHRAFWCAVLLVGSSALSVSVSAYAGVLASALQYRALALASLSGFVIQVLFTLLLLKRWGVLGLGWASVAGASWQAFLVVWLAQNLPTKIKLRPTRIRWAECRRILGYASSLTVLSGTAALSSSSDPVILGALRGGSAATVFRISSMPSVTLANLLYMAFGVVFPRLAGETEATAQEEAVAWLGRIVGWISGVAFAVLALMGGQIIAVILGHTDHSGVVVLWITAAALCLDVSYHGVVQVVFARGQQRAFVWGSVAEAIINLVATFAAVAAFGVVGSAVALAITTLATDFFMFPFLMRRKWSTPPGRFVLSNGVRQSVCGGAAVLLLAQACDLLVGSVVVNPVRAIGSGAIVLAFGYLSMRGASRRRLRSLVT